MIDPLPRPNLLENSWLFILTIRGNNNVDRLPHRLLSLPSKNPLRAAVPGGDDSIQSLTDDGVVGRFDNRGEPRLDLCQIGRHLRREFRQKLLVSFWLAAHFKAQSGEREACMIY